MSELVIKEDLVASGVNDLKSVIKDIINCGETEILINLENVEVIDSSGIGFLIATQNTLNEVDGKLSINGVSEEIMKMFKMMRLDHHFEIYGRD